MLPPNDLLGGGPLRQALCRAAACLVVLCVVPLGGCPEEEKRGRPETEESRGPDLPVPDISKLESVVQEQIRTARAELDKNPDDADAAGRLGMLYQLYDLEDAADALYRRAAALNPNAHRWYYLRGRMLRANDKLDEAVEAFRAAVSVSDTSRAALVALGGALAEKGETEAARDVFEKVLQLDPDLPVARYLLGELELRAGRLDQAITHLKRAAAEARRAGPIHRLLAEAYEKQGRSERAERERILACSPVGVPPVTDEDAAAYFRLAKGSEYELQRARRSARVRRWTEAIAHVDQALATAPQSLKALHLKAEILSRTGKPDEAVEILQKARAAAPDDPKTLCSLAAALTAAGQSGEVESLLNKAVTLDAKCGPAYLGLADLRRREGKMDEALELQRKGVECVPDQLNPRFQLARYLLSQGREDEALGELRRILADQPSYAPAHVSIGFTLKKRGDSPGAIRHFQCALAANPALVGAYSALADEYFKQGQFGQADKLLEDAMRQVPDSAELVNIVAWLRATCPESLYRSGREALRLSLDICRRTNFEQSALVDTLAAAYAENGDFQAAVKYQQQAIDAAKAAGDPVPPDMMERLTLYQAGKPYRMAPTADASAPIDARGPDAEAGGTGDPGTP